METATTTTTTTTITSTRPGLDDIWELCSSIRCRILLTSSAQKKPCNTDGMTFVEPQANGVTTIDQALISRKAGTYDGAVALRSQ